MKNKNEIAMWPFWASVQMSLIYPNCFWRNGSSEQDSALIQKLSLQKTTTPVLYDMNNCHYQLTIIKEEENILQKSEINKKSYKSQ